MRSKKDKRIGLWAKNISINDNDRYALRKITLLMRGRESFQVY